ncbi:MAG TPA: thioredoxin domain-containing protein [Coriobacteriia bacterium]|jgi:hypothetical protein
MSPNRLAGSRSPYLLMHAEDPIDWRPWGKEALAFARETQRPIFLSSGYSACHWCHVMHRDSFTDPEIAEILNESFVPVKVDRELRPDVDSVYMDYVVATTGHGGWPMSVFLSPEGLPLLGGTYFPKTPLPRTPAFREVVLTVRDVWQNDRASAEKAGQAALAFLAEQVAPKAAEPPTPPLIDYAAESMLRGSDQVHGGFGDAPKFPQAPVLLFLLAYAQRTGDPEVLYQTESAVQAMLGGGIFDQAGGGIARYATDEAWLVPHFEKMLYDNGLLLSVLGRLYALAQQDEYAHAARQTAAFLQRDLAAPGGGFYAALSADTDGVEGATYVWRYEELAEILTAEELQTAERHLGVTREGNWEGTNILTRREGREEEPEAVDRVLERILQARSGRPQPDVDTKVLTSWNALAARGLMEAGGAIGDREMTGLGVAVVRTLLDAVSDAEVPRESSERGGVRLLEDHAALVAACLTAYETLGEESFLADAERLQSSAVERFEDGGLLYMTEADTELPVRPREQGDTPTPSGPATLVENALRLHALTGEQGYLEWAGAALPQFHKLEEFAPEHAGTSLLAAMRYLDTAR